MFYGLFAATQGGANHLRLSRRGARHCRSRFIVARRQYRRCLRTHAPLIGARSRRGTCARLLRHHARGASRVVPPFPRPAFRGVAGAFVGSFVFPRLWWRAPSWCAAGRKISCTCPTGSGVLRFSTLAPWQRCLYCALPLLSCWRAWCVGEGCFALVRRAFARHVRNAVAMWPVLAEPLWLVPSRHGARVGAPVGDFVPGFAGACVDLVSNSPKPLPRQGRSGSAYVQLVVAKLGLHL